MLLGSFMGTGAQLIGHRPVSPGVYEAQRWVTVLFVPVLPVDGWVIQPLALQGINLGAVVGETFRFRVLGRVRVSPWRVGALYAAILATTAAALLPYAFVMSWLPKGPKPAAQVALMFMVTVWPLVVLGVVNHRRERLYDRDGPR